MKCFVWSLQGTSVGMEYYGKGIGPGGGGQFSMAQQNFIPGPVGDGMPNNMWNPQMKGQVSEASDKVVNTVLISLGIKQVLLNFIHLYFALESGLNTDCHSTKYLYKTI